jgi:hypothetical protein
MTKACTAPTSYRIDGDRVRRHDPHIPGRSIGPVRQQTVNVMKSVRWVVRALLLSDVITAPVPSARAQAAPAAATAHRHH